MENKNIGLKILIVILGIIVLVLAGYIIYDKLSNTNNCFNYTIAKRTTSQAVRGDFVEVLVDTNGDAYLYPIKNLNANIGLKSLESQAKVYSPKGYETLDNQEFNAIKLDINKVLTSYYVHAGNGGFTYFIFVTEDGKLAYINYDKMLSDGKVDLQKIDELNNIISVVDNT